MLTFIKQRKNQRIYLEIEVTLESKMKVACINILKKVEDRKREEKKIYELLTITTCRTNIT